MEKHSVNLWAHDKQSGAAYCKTVKVASKEELAKEIEIFDKEVPFSRWYSDHTNESDCQDVDVWIEEL